MSSDTIIDSRLYVRHALDDASWINDQFGHTKTNAGYLSSHLLLYDRIVIPTLDFGIVPAIIGWIGLQSFEEALDQGAIQFLRPRGILAYVGNGTALSVITMLPGSGPKFAWWQEAMWGSQEGAVDIQLRERVPSLSRTAREALTRRIYDRSQPVRYTNAEFMQHVAQESYRDVACIPEFNSAAQTGHNLHDDLLRLPGVEANQVRVSAGPNRPMRDGVDVVLRTAELNLEIMMASQVGNADLETIDLAPAVIESKLVRAGIDKGISDSFVRLLDFKGLPDVAAAVGRGVVSPSDVWKLRNKPNSRNFRKWIRESTIRNGNDVVKAYLEAVEKPPWIDQFPAKTIRFGLTSAAGLLGLGPGLAAGAADSFFVSRWLRGYSPKLFLDQTAELVLKNQ